MSEPSSSVPGEIADAQVEEPEAGGEEVEKVGLDIDEEKMEAWDDVKADYQVEPGGQPVANSMDQTGLIGDEEDDAG